MNDKKSKLKNRYKELYSTVEAVLFHHDPIRINFGFNPDEYDPEVGTILPRLKNANSENDVVDIIHEELVRWFGINITGDKKQPVYRKMASEVWKAWLKFSEPTSPQNERR
jgi:hypothetical protein